MIRHSLIPGIAILALIVFNCGNGGGGNPVGVTAGSPDGYGAKNFGLEDGTVTPVPNPNPGVSDEFYGTWVSHDYVYGISEVLTINTDGTYILEISVNYYTFTITGYYSFEGDQLLIDGEPANYSISGDVLIMEIDGEPVIFTRMNFPV